MLALAKARDPLRQTMEAFAKEMRRDSEFVVRRAHRGITRRVVAVSPPAHGGVLDAGFTLGRDAYRAGANRIARQMSAVMAPRTLKGKRTVTQAFGRPLARPVTYPTKERHPDVAGLYRNQLAASRGGRRLSLTGFKGTVLFVSRAKFRAELTRRQGRVGRMAAGWASGAAFAKVALPAWVARHGTGGGNINFTAFGGSRIVTRNFGRGLSPAIRGELARRIPYAVGYQRAAMQREIDYMVAKRAQQRAIRGRDISSLVPAGMHGA